MNNRPKYDDELQDLSTELIKMGATAAQAIEKAMKAIKDSDKELAKEIIEGDRVINDMEKDIEHRCLRLILKQQPVARDLRKVSTAIKMVTDIERIGDAASDIAEITIHLDECEFQDIKNAVLNMAETAKNMVVSAIDAYVEENMILALNTIKQDDIVDECFLSIRRELSKRLIANEHEMDVIMDYLMIIKYLERVGDHAVNVCEWVQFYMTGVHNDEKIV
ncbi:MAG: phosphate signaling complex protein PhoU [Lachnospiraceae bacterium]|mgnify:CR=1 FL=1|nr:phosphate signaling complex protein PhoU [Lachnospiraceae bacterium]MDD6857135.1 phosphate signaling complex protein PhoU [Lachnospiraceae bacterium]